MSRRFDNKKNLYILGGLLVLLALTVLVRIPRQRSTLKEKLISMDTSKVARITLTPRIGESTPFDFIRKNGTWIIQQGNITATPEKDVVQNILLETTNLKPKSLEAVDESKWKEFNLTDSLSIRVTFSDSKGKILSDLLIGKFTYNQVNNPSAGPRGGGIQGTSFVRLRNDRKVYAIDGFLALSFSGKFNDYRDKSFLKVNKDDIIRITFKFPADSSFVLEKKNNKWLAGGKETDSTTVTGYLNSLRYLNGQEFRDGYKPASEPYFSMLIDGNNMLNATVKCFRGDNDDDFILNSSLNPDIYFSSKKEGLFNEMFKSEKYFLPKPAKKQSK